LWAGDELLDVDDTSSPPYFPTENVTVDPARMSTQMKQKYLVQPDSPFEIRVVGMSVVAQDFQWPCWRNRNWNELVLYSLQCEKDAHSDKMHDVGVPRVHYHYSQEEEVKPDAFHEVPFSRSLVHRSCESPTLGYVGFRFKILEIDEVDKNVRDAINGIGQLGNQVSSVTTGLPYLSLVSPAIQLAGEVGRRALEAYAKPDQVQTIDVGFRIAPSKIDGNTRPHEYLRYGYYFFLSEPTRYRLYASTATYNNVALMVKRVGQSRSTSKFGSVSCASGAADKLGGQPDFIPLTGINYLVVRVSKPSSTSKTSGPVTPRITLSSLQKLRHCLESAKMEPADDVKRNIVSIMEEINGASEPDQSDASSSVTDTADTREGPVP
jgi:hypothetical protein